MAIFFARVELHNASSADYEKLHAEMYKNGFYRIIVDMSPKNHHMHLPTGCYASYTDGNLDAVAAQIRQVADAVTYLNKVYCAKVADDRVYLDNF